MRMTDREQFPLFAAVIAETFAVEPTVITPETTAADLDGWDSVSHATLIMMIEERYGVRFPDDEIFRFENVGELFARTMELAKQA
jgi:acyl carrier protein